MRRNTVDVVALFLTIALCLAASARAESSCTSVLTAGQVSELDRLIFPGHPFSPHLSDALDSDTAHGLVVTSTGARSSYMPMMTVSEAFSDAAVWFLGDPTSAGMHEGSMTFTASTTGTYQYLCPVPGHAQKGMVGTFVVES